jgi:dienelactone hydrolase
MEIETRKVEYRHDDVLLEGVLAWESGMDKDRPAVLIFHGWEGRSESQIDFAKELAEWGYVGFAADLYGKGVAPNNLRRTAKIDDAVHARPGAVAKSPATDS